MPFGLRRRLRDGGGNHRAEVPGALPPLDLTYRPVPHLFVAPHAAEQPATFPIEPAVEPVAEWVPAQPVPVPVPAPRSAMRPAEALAELSALARG